MPQVSEADPLGPEGGPRSYSCLLCRQRKVKCDRRSPCSNCVKADKQCSFVPPVRGKRKRTKPPRESLHAKLKRYEDLLGSLGVDIEQSRDSDESGSETTSQPDVETGKIMEPHPESHNDPFGLEETEHKFIAKEGTSRYFENALWLNLGDGSHHPEEDGFGEPKEDSQLHESRMFFEPEDGDRTGTLASFHPPPQVLSKLKYIYTDRVDPMIKILHLPTFWVALANGLRRPQDMSKGLEAAIFAFYFATVNSLTEEECHGLFSTPRSVILCRYRFAARQALINASFLSTSSLMTLRAYAIFMLCVRNSYRCDTLFVLSGIAIRLARKMGLHRDGTSLGLSPFETEMRRRLWWHLIHMDFRTSDVLDTRPSLDLSYGDTQVPLNVEDEDLHPDMDELPPERQGITCATLCLTRCRIGEILRNFSTSRPGEMRWEALNSSDFAVSKKDSVIRQVEDHWERKYLRYCDPSNAYHTFVSISMRSSICKMKIFAHNPRPSADRPVKVPKRGRDIVFESALKQLEYFTMVQKGSHGLDKYRWQLGTSYLWKTMLYLLIEARRTKTGPLVERSWQLIGEAFSHCPGVFEEDTPSVYVALGRWTLDLWDIYVEASKASGLSEPCAPEYISAIRRCRRPGNEVLCRTNKTQPQGHDNIAGSESLEPYNVPDLLSFEIDMNEWVQWEQLVAEQGGIGQMGGM
ncbi:hypothetical protein M426DRAFT_27562 [Hypoxylon sp. CI-4A]|nr:hypothetical protein M426DRAFT_27562 [Hypoxylon sp. CI-4A]